MILTFESAFPYIIPVKESTIIPSLQMGKPRPYERQLVELGTRASSPPDTLLCLF